MPIAVDALIAGVPSASRRRCRRVQNAGAPPMRSSPAGRMWTTPAPRRLRRGAAVRATRRLRGGAPPDAARRRRSATSVARSRQLGGPSGVRKPCAGRRGRPRRVRRQPVGRPGRRGAGTGPGGQAAARGRRLAESRSGASVAGSAWPYPHRRARVCADRSRAGARRCASTRTAPRLDTGASARRYRARTGERVEAERSATARSGGIRSTRVDAVTVSPRPGRPNSTTRHRRYARGRDIRARTAGEPRSAGAGPVASAPAASPPPGSPETGGQPLDLGVRTRTDAGHGARRSDVRPAGPPGGSEPASAGAAAAGASGRAMAVARHRRVAPSARRGPMRGRTDAARSALGRPAGRAAGAPPACPTARRRPVRQCRPVRNGPGSTVAAAPLAASSHPAVDARRSARRSVRGPR